MSGLRLVFRALRDTWENLVIYTLLSVVWWGCMVTIVAGPSATLALYLFTDPRHGISTDRPTFGETVRLILQRLWISWKLALMTFPAAVLLLYNIVFYGATDSRIGFIAPLWFVLFLLWFCIAQCAFALLALNESVPSAAFADEFEISPALRHRTTWECLKLGAVVVGARLPMVIVLAITTWLIVGLSAVLVVPFFTFMPALIANIYNRLTLHGLRINIVDPFAPTPERRAELPTQRRRWFGP